MGGGLMQLVAYGAQDVYLTGNPQITFFKVVYRRHTNFAVENIEQVFNGTSDFGRKTTCQISRNGDLITKTYLRVQLPSLDLNPTAIATNHKKWAWVSRIGHVLINSVELEIGGTRIDKQYGDWLNIWYELARNWAHDRGYDIMIGNTHQLTTLSPRHDAAILYIPLKFFNNRNDGLAIPLIALQYHEVKFNFEFSQLMSCINTTHNVTQTDVSPLNMSASLYVDYVYLDTEERKRFAQAQHEYLIEQVQFTGSESVPDKNQKVRLNFNHPCKALYWMMQLGRFNSGNSFLAYDPHNFDNVLLDATKRFILAHIDTDPTTGLIRLWDFTTTPGTYTPGGNSNVVLPSAYVAGLTSITPGATPITPAQQAMFNLFARIDPLVVQSKVEPIMANVMYNGELLTLEEVSMSINDSAWYYTTRDHIPSTPTINVWDSTKYTRTTDPNNHGSQEYDIVLHQHDNYGLFLNKTFNPVQQVLLQLNGHDRFSTRDGSYFNYVQPYQHHSNTPTDGLNMYSFSLNPEDHQPSGTCNMSRIDNATLSVYYNDGLGRTSPSFKEQYLSDDSLFSIYATNYNVLRIMSGMGGLAYSN